MNPANRPGRPAVKLARARMLGRHPPPPPRGTRAASSWQRHDDKRHGEETVPTSAADVVFKRCIQTCTKGGRIAEGDSDEKREARIPSTSAALPLCPDSGFDETFTP